MDKENQASQYAKAKVQELRAKIYAPIVAKAKHLSCSFQSRLTQNSSMIPPEITKNQTLHLTVLKPRAEKISLNDTLEYQNRIKNINKINDKIKNILGEKKENLPENKILRQKSQQIQRQQETKKKQPLFMKGTQKSFHKQKAGQYQFSSQNLATKQTVTLKKIVPESSFFQKDCSENIKGIQLINSLNKERNIPIIEYGQLSLMEKEKQSKLLPGNEGRKPSIQNSLGNKQIQSFSSCDQNEQIIKLAETLGKQIELDQQLREKRCSFQELNLQNKWQILLEGMKKDSPSLNLEQLKSEVLISSEEHNPFLEIKKSNDSRCIQQLIKADRNAKKFWRQNVHECASIKKLEIQGFNVRNIDLNKKGYLSIEDFACFINLYSGSFFRNRDTFTLFKRFQKGGESKVKYETFLDEITKN